MSFHSWNMWKMIVTVAWNREAFHRLINHEINESMKDALWSPERFVRAPGGSASSVAIALATLGGKVAFMGKLGDDDYGKDVLLQHTFPA
ncbi:hypothetical protein RJT34_31641 [Clitoria ternatea]|uniref:Carbohydrate kinase PfkB domain-containing protein n=1 Tax=Clitoria ternatea TaxID=43366 RepID=A0AAN9I3S1_CLITE